MILVARCTTPPQVPSDVVNCGNCGHDCWISQYAKRSIFAADRQMGGNGLIICMDCMEALLGTIKP